MASSDMAEIPILVFLTKYTVVADGRLKVAGMISMHAIFTVLIVFLENLPFYILEMMVIWTRL